MSTQNRKHDNFLFKNDENTNPKGRALKLMSRVPKTKRGNL